MTRMEAVHKWIRMRDRVDLRSFQRNGFLIFKCDAKINFTTVYSMITRICYNHISVRVPCNGSFKCFYYKPKQH